MPVCRLDTGLQEYPREDRGIAAELSIAFLSEGPLEGIDEDYGWKTRHDEES